jgi:hypothetical protein
MLSAASLTAQADTFHTVAQTQWRQAARADSTLVYLPEHGQPTLQLLVCGAPPATADAARTARELGAVALVLTGEAWGMVMPTEKAGRLPSADRPRPSESPERYEAILTTAVGADGLTVLRETRITTGAFGRTLTPSQLSDPGQNPDGLASWMHEVLTLAARHGN